MSSREFGTPKSASPMVFGTPGSSRKKGSSISSQHKLAHKVVKCRRCPILEDELEEEMRLRQKANRQCVEARDLLFELSEIIFKLLKTSSLAREQTRSVDEVVEKIADLLNNPSSLVESITPVDWIPALKSCHKPDKPFWEYDKFISNLLSVTIHLQYIVLVLLPCVVIKLEQCSSYM